MSLIIENISGRKQYEINILHIIILSLEYRKCQFLSVTVELSEFGFEYVELQISSEDRPLFSFMTNCWKRRTTHVNMSTDSSLMTVMTLYHQMSPATEACVHSPPFLSLRSTSMQKTGIFSLFTSSS